MAHSTTLDSFSIGPTLLPSFIIRQIVSGCKLLMGLEISDLASEIDGDKAVDISLSSKFAGQIHSTAEAATTIF